MCYKLVKLQNVMFRSDNRITFDFIDDNNAEGLFPAN